MFPDSVLAKTPKGVEEIERRTYHLQSRLRQALIRIDGVKTIDEHLELAGDLADALLVQFEELEREGFVIDTTPATQPLEPEPVAETVPMPPPAPAPKPAPAPRPAPAPAPTAAESDAEVTQPVSAAVSAAASAAASAAVSFDSPVKFRLGDLLVDAMGPETGKLGTTLQSCRNREDLAKWVAYAYPRIQEAAGKDKAKTFYKSAKQLVG